MTHFIFYALNRFLSGSKNGAYYGRKHNDHDVWSILLLLSILIYPFFVVDDWRYLLSPIPAMAVFLMWKYGMTRYLHLWESFTSNTFMIYGLVLGADVLLYPLTSMIVNVLFFKTPINYYIGKAWILSVDATDDPTGKTTGYPTPWGEFKVPRISNGFIQLGIGLVLYTLWYLLQKNGYSYTIYEVWEMIF